MTVGEILKNKRIELNYTQEDIAKKLYISRQSISNWELGKSYPDIEKLILLSDLYKISLDSLVKDDYKMAEKLKEDSKGKKLRLIGFITEQISALILGSLLTSLYLNKEIPTKLLIVLIIMTLICSIITIWRVIPLKSFNN